MRVNSVAANSAVPTGYADSGFVDIRQMNLLAIDGLSAMFDPATKLFCHRLKLEGTTLVREGISRRYTIMTALGLERCKAAGLDQPFNTQEILHQLVRDLNWIDDIGDLGLLLWFCAVESPDRLSWLCSQADVKRASERFVQGHQVHTMSMAWFLTGLAYAAQAAPALMNGLEDTASATYRLLIGNQGKAGVFGHLRASFKNFWRNHIGSFADQVYPMVALTRYAEVFKVKDSLDRAHQCAEMICRHQGSFGQWWWHYSAASGSVVEKYPVYSVHQDGMGPMALFAVGEATGTDFGEPIYKGLRWIAGANERSLDLRDSSASLIWRCLYLRSNYQRQVERLRGAFGIEGKEFPGDALAVRRECRPYHLGWLLYAFAGRENAGLRSL